MTMTNLPQQLGISIVHVDGHSHIRLTGEIDLANAAELRRHLDWVIAAGTGDVELECSDVSFLDSSGLAVLFAAHQQLRDTHHRLTVRNPSRPVLRVLELSGLLDVLIDDRRGWEHRVAE
jgi:stage II sporulation protein AA (anti-sigma F factor antagonist)